MDIYLSDTYDNCGLYFSTVEIWCESINIIFYYLLQPSHGFILKKKKKKKNQVCYCPNQREEEYRAKQQAMNILKYIFFKCHISFANI